MGGVGELEGNKLEASSLEPGEDLSNKSSLDSIRLDHDVGSLLVS